MKEQQSRALMLLNLHQSDRIFVLPNAWDAVSAKIFELEGYQGIATTSGGVASSLGFADGQRMSLDEMISAVKRIVSCTSLPVSADMEAGYGESPAEVEKTTKAVLASGAVGMNLEDSSSSNHTLLGKTQQCEKIVAARRTATDAKVHLVLNARTDTYLVPFDDPSEQLRQTIQRGNAYREAGADCIFVPDVGAMNAATIRTLVEEIDAPINILAGASTPSLSELEDLGVRRVTLGPRPMRALLALLRRMAREIREDGTFKLMTAEEIPYAEVNAWFDDEN